MGSINKIKYLSTVLSNAVKLTTATSKFPQKIFWEWWDVNPGPLGGNQVCYPQGVSIVRTEYRTQEAEWNKTERDFWVEQNRSDPPTLTLWYATPPPHHEGSTSFNVSCQLLNDDFQLKVEEAIKPFLIFKTGADPIKYLGVKFYSILEFDQSN